MTVCVGKAFSGKEEVASLGAAVSLQQGRVIGGELKLRDRELLSKLCKARQSGEACWAEQRKERVFFLPSLPLVSHIPVEPFLICNDGQIGPGCGQISGGARQSAARRREQILCGLPGQR